MAPDEPKLQFPDLPDDTPAFEQTPLTRVEYITALARLTTSLNNPTYARAST